ncbi:alpha/beta fold hydrolase [Streptomyces sp. NP-1717]|uniref:alpha/beta fold hydrolase n=1 Tax=Streptomyces sp. NP-1717 TaxID=2704470 RepID=UPI001F5D194C|nr:alpha/beta hydrolase [Streptomyces sp. NP-1717]MCI3220742.1 alpha/beta hydrolase [Streptomyces sp. NP-1717]
MPTAEINGIPLHYNSTGDGPMVVLVMGTGAAGRAWHLHQVGALTRAGFRAVTFDNRGVGATRGVGPFTIDDMVTDTAGLIEHLGAGPALVVGTSLGARVTTELALARPDLVRGALLMATRGRLDRTRRAALDAEIAIRDSGVRLPAAYDAAMKALQNLSPRTLDDDRRAADWLELFELAGDDGSGTRVQIGLGAFPDRLAAYRDVSVPCRVLGFADDLVCPPHLGREVAQAIPDCDFRLVEGCGHYGYLERPDEVNALVLEFLAERQTTPGGVRVPAGDIRPATKEASA